LVLDGLYYEYDRISIPPLEHGGELPGAHVDDFVELPEDAGARTLCVG
jgi:hypothetical protein